MWLMDKKKTNEVTLNSMAGPLRGQRTGSEEVKVFQEAPRRGHPLDLSVWGLPQGFSAHVGNPHLVIFLDSFEGIDIEKLGSQLDRHPGFKEGQMWSLSL